MTELEQAILECNKRLAQLSGVPLLPCRSQSWLETKVRCVECGQDRRHALNCSVAFPEPDHSWWDDWVKTCQNRLQSDETLLKQVRPLHEEWSDADGLRWIADGSGTFYCLEQSAQKIPQSQAAGFWREEPRRQAVASDLVSVNERASRRGKDSAWVKQKLQECCGPFPPVSWYAIAGVNKLLYALETIQGKQEGFQKQAAKFTERSEKASRKLSRNRSR